MIALPWLWRLVYTPRNFALFLLGRVLYNGRSMANIFQKTRTFWAEMLGELKKASWPTFPELRGSTWIIIAAVLILGMYVALSDFSVYNWVTMLTKWIKSL